jgi:hypothetical protein
MFIKNGSSMIKKINVKMPAKILPDEVNIYSERPSYSSGTYNKLYGENANIFDAYSFKEKFEEKLRQLAY